MTSPKHRMERVVQKIYKIRVITTPKIERGGFMPSFKIFCNYAEFYNSLDYDPVKEYKDMPHVDFVPYPDLKKSDKK